MTAVKAERASVRALSERKKLPIEFLTKEIGLRDTRVGVEIPYRDVEGLETAVKKRTALRAKDGSFWPAGRKLQVYGEWRQFLAQKRGYIFLVEGESDCWALWFHGWPALGLPGSGTAKALTLTHLQGVDEVFIAQEPDQGGEFFVAGVRKHLREIGYDGKVAVLQFPDGIEDFSALHICNPDNFDDVTHEMHYAAESEAREPDADSLSARVILADVQPKSIEWLWPNWLPANKLTVLDGDPGLGKSSLALDLAARLSRGAPMPFSEQTGSAGNVILLSAEDDPADTLRPRLEAAGADLSRICAVPKVPFIAKEGGVLFLPPRIPQDLGALRREIRRFDARLMIIDPLMAFLSGSVNSHNDQHIRTALAQMTDLADEERVAVLVIRHLNKNEQTKTAMYRGGGSIGIVGAARAGWLVAKDPDDSRVRILAVTKSNLAAPPRSLRFAVEPAGKSTRIGWIGEAETAADALLTSEAGSDAVDEAADFLQQLLTEGPRPAADVLGEAAAAGIDSKTLRRAKRRLGVQSRRVGNQHSADSHWCWTLRQ